MNMNRKRKGKGKERSPSEVFVGTLLVAAFIAAAIGLLIALRRQHGTTCFTLAKRVAPTSLADTRDSQVLYLSE